MSLFIIQRLYFLLLFFKLLDILFLGKRTLIKVRRKGLMNVLPPYPLNSDTIFSLITYNIP